MERVRNIPRVRDRGANRFLERARIWICLGVVFDSGEPHIVSGALMFSSFTHARIALNERPYREE